MKDTVLPLEKKRRLKELDNLLRIIAEKNNQVYLGQEVEVLVESKMVFRWFLGTLDQYLVQQFFLNKLLSCGI